MVNRLDRSGKGWGVGLVLAAGIILASACADAASKGPLQNAGSLPSVVKQTSLTGLVKQTMALWFEGSPQEKTDLRTLAGSLPAMRQYDSPKGVFVTLSQAGKTRACWGSVFPKHDNVRTETVYATIDALTKEYRYRPVSKNEWRTLKPQVTVVTGLARIEKISQLNPLRDGLMMRAGSKSCVILPGEATDAHYQGVLCRLKAGLRPNEAAQLYRIKADVYQ